MYKASCHPHWSFQYHMHPHATFTLFHCSNLTTDHPNPAQILGSDGIRWDPRIWQVALQHTSLAWVAAAPEVWTPLLASAQLAVAPLAAKGGRVKASALSHLFEDETGASGSLRELRICSDRAQPDEVTSHSTFVTADDQL